MTDRLAFAGLVVAPNAISFALVKLIGGGSACPQSSLQPPGYVFGIAWTILYLLYGVSMALVYRKKEYGTFRSLCLLLIGLNLWWVLFGPSCMPVPALVSILAMLVGCISVISNIFSKDKVSAGLLIPLAAWLSFASVLSIQQVQILYRS